MTPEQAAFDYDLPRELIAQEPLRNRADARLMVIDRARQSIDHFHVRDLPEILRAGDRLVLNNTRVVPARLVGVRTATGGAWQGLFLHTTEDGHWRILQKTRGRIQPGESVTLFDRNSRPQLKLWLLEKGQEGEWLAHLESDEPVFDLLEKIGRVPLPPYIRGGHMMDSDVESYQTVFAKRRGAVAAPTAGLHFTRAVLERLAARGVDFTAVTLHVGLDTFRPISTETIEDHRMHTEWCEVTEKAAAEINATRATGGRIIAVGTTSVRVLETAARMRSAEFELSPTASPPPPGWGRGSGGGGEAEERSQETWDAKQVAGASGQGTADSGQQPGASGDSPIPRSIPPFTGTTDLFIRPPFEFRAVDALMTNFHFPRTTLLVLVCTLSGRDLMHRAYEEAVRQRYRFYSYGDAMLIL